MKSKNEIVIYQADELTKVEVQIDEETVWRSQEQMAALFGRNRVAITQHIGNIFKEGELEKEVVCKEFLLTTQHGALQGKTQHKKVKQDIEKHNAQYPAIEIKQFKHSHDCFLIIDASEVYHIGASLKDLGKKWFAFTKIEGFTAEILGRLKGGANEEL